MNGETNLTTLLKSMQPKLNSGAYVFCTIKNENEIDLIKVLLIFREEEAITVILSKETADSLQLEYSFVASWITLTVHSSLSAVGLTAAFSKALSDAGISCNVVAAYYHDHIFVDCNDATRAMSVLHSLSQQASF
jgi:hypothetical protein